MTVATPLPVCTANLALGLVRQMALKNAQIAELEARNADLRQDVTALTETLHAAVSALHNVTRARDRYQTAYHQQIDVNRELRAARATASQRSAA